MEQREILFKAKSLYSDKWLKGDLVHAPLGTRIEWWENNALLVEDIDPSTVCQFTGLKDKDGNDIFEHDLLTKDGTVVYKVGYVNCGFAASYEDEDDFSLNLLAISKYCRICGSKFNRKEEK